MFRIWKTSNCLRNSILLIVLATTWGRVEAQVAVETCPEGNRLHREHNFTEAQVAFKECLDAQGPHVEILLPLTVMSVQEGRLTDAVEFGQAAVAMDSTNAEARYWYGRALLRSGRTQEAKRQWEAGLQQTLSHLGLLEGMARLALAENESAKAYQLLTQMERQGVREPWLSRLLADIAADKALWAESLLHFGDALAMENGGTPADLLTAADLSMMAGDHPGAVAYCRRAVMIEPSAATFGGLGQAYFVSQELDSAIVYLRQATEADPTYGRYRFNLANALEVNGQVEEADYHFRTFLEQNPNDSVGRFNYGVHLEKMGRSAEALFEIKGAVTLDPGMLTARVVQIQILENLGRWEEALVELEELRQRDVANGASLNEWYQRLSAQRDQAGVFSEAGKVHLLHMILGTQELVDVVQRELAAQADFSSLVVQFSRGSAASKGGSIGWVAPSDMTSPMREAIEALAINDKIGRASCRERV